jgi:pyruvate formate-lyase/glycerol dehydratase family glycyl radical enzyme
MDRGQRLKEFVYSHQPSICPERAEIFTDSFRRTGGQPMILRRARAFESVLAGMSLYISPEELIVGNQARKPRSAPVFPEFNVDWIERELEELPGRALDPFQVDETAGKVLRRIGRYWKGRTHHDRTRSLVLALLPEDLLRAYDFDTHAFDQVVSNRRMNDGDGHIIANYRRILETGLLEVVWQAEAEAAKLDLRSAEGQEKRLFLESLRIVCSAAVNFARRFAAEARRLARIENTPARRGELLAIAANCERVPAHPARTFWEALQSCWFQHLLIQIESNGHSISLGRFDQYIHPFYQRDLRRSILTRERAAELLECFWVKCCEIIKFKERVLTRFQSGYPLFQALTVGGVTPEGTTAVNELSYLCLEVSGRMKTVQPTTMVRIARDTPQDFLLAACRSLLEHGGGLPAFFGDEAALPMLEEIGVPLEEARDWAVMGCAEVQVAGRFLPATGGTSHVNLLKILEITLNGGVNPSTGRSVFPESGKLAGLRSYRRLFQSFKRRLESYISVVPILDTITSRSYAALTPTPFLSALVDGRVACGKDVSEGGCAHNNQVCLGYGLANTANSLASLKKLLFEERRFEAGELKAALDGDFSGPGGEGIRQILLNRGPKFGNDDEFVDEIARKVADLFADAIRRHTPCRGGVYGPTTQTLTANVPQGMVVGATPDGRRAGEPLADNNSPSAGTDLNGPTAAIRSVTRLDHTRFSNGTVFNLKFHPSVFSGGPERLGSFTALIRTFFELGGFQVQFNILSAETLAEAKKNPEKYRNLVVKVAGYSAQFVMLDGSLQDQIIQRTMHQLG